MLQGHFDRLAQVPYKGDRAALSDHLDGSVDGGSHADGLEYAIDAESILNPHDGLDLFGIRGIECGVRTELQRSFPSLGECIKSKHTTGSSGLQDLDHQESDQASTDHRNRFVHLKGRDGDGMRGDSRGLDERGFVIGDIIGNLEEYPVRNNHIFGEESVPPVLGAGTPRTVRLSQRFTLPCRQ